MVLFLALRRVPRLMGTFSSCFLLPHGSHPSSSETFSEGRATADEPG